MLPMIALRDDDNLPSVRSSVASENSLRRPRSSVAGSEPIATEQMPRGVAATRTWPTEHLAIVYLTVSPFAPAAYRAGVIPSTAPARSVHPTRRAVACGEPGIGDTVAGSQRRFQTAGAAGVRIFTRRDAEHAFERPKQVVLADARGSGQRPQRDAAAVRTRDAAARLPHAFDRRIQRRRAVGPAPLARPEAGASRILRAREEGDPFRAGSATRAGRPAIDARRGHRVDEHSVPAGVPFCNRTPQRPFIKHVLTIRHRPAGRYPEIDLKL